MEKNQLYYGDNLTVLRKHIKDESVGLMTGSIYLQCDPTASHCARALLHAVAIPLGRAQMS